MRLEFTIPPMPVETYKKSGEPIPNTGGFCWNNRADRFVKGMQRPMESRAAKGQKALVADLAFAAALACGWDRTAPAYEVWITAWNVFPDVDGIPKVILDGAAGVLYINDNDIIDCHLSRRVDWGGKRVTFAIEDREKQERPPKPKPGMDALFDLIALGR